MNLLLDLIAISEDLRAKVHVNPTGELKVILNLIKKEFSLSSQAVSMTCLWAQSVYAIAVKLNVKPEVIAVELDKALKKHYEGKIIYDGVTPEQVVNNLNGRVFKLKRDMIKLNVGFIAYSSLQEILAAIDEGHPVIVPINGSSPMNSHIQHFARRNQGYVPDHSADDVAVTNMMHHSYHAYLAVGYDTGDKTLVLRDSRSAYSFKGYAKVPFSVVQKHVSVAFTYTVNVEKVK